MSRIFITLWIIRKNLRIKNVRYITWTRSSRRVAYQAWKTRIGPGILEKPRERTRENEQRLTRSRYKLSDLYIDLLAKVSYLYQIPPQAAEEIPQGLRVG